MPEPTIFLDRAFPTCSIIRPTETDGTAMAVLNAPTADGLFVGQSQAFFTLLNQLARTLLRLDTGGPGSTRELSDEIKNSYSSGLNCSNTLERRNSSCL
jgi:hypothetical protein